MKNLPKSLPFASEHRLPPSFESAANLRQKARAAGLDPSHWYPVEIDRKLRKGQVIEATFWKRSIAVFRGADGAVHAIENRCAHRQLKLSRGEVQGCTLVCLYHGWTYDGSGTNCLAARCRNSACHRFPCRSAMA